MSVMTIILICSLLFFVAATLFILLKRTKERRALIKAIKDNKAAYDEHFTNEEEKFKKILGAELSESMKEMIAEVIKVESDSYKKLCTLFIDHHSEAIQLLPYTMNQITTAYFSCLNQVVAALNKKVEAISVQESKPEEGDLFQYEALIEQLRFEKQTYSDKCKDFQNLLTEIHLKYKEKLGLSTIESLHSMNINDLTTLFKLKNDPEELAGQKNESSSREEIDDKSLSIEDDGKKE